MSNQYKVSDFELDQLKEVVNMGASHASTALNQMINKKIQVTVPEISITDITNLIKHIGNKDEIATIVAVRVLGDAVGMMFFVFPGLSALKLSELISNEKSSKNLGDTLDKYNMSVIKEAGNILSGSCLNALSKFLEYNLIQAVSEVITDKLSSISNIITSRSKKNFDTILVFRVNLNITSEEIVTHLYFFMDPEFTSKILESAKKKLK